MFKTFLLVAACFIFADARKYDNYFWDDYRDFVLAKRQGQKAETFMCYLSGNAANILKTSKSDYNGKISSLTTRYTDDAKCKRNNKIKLKGNRHFECRPIKNEIMEKIPGSDWTTKKITVGCKVVILP